MDAKAFPAGGADAVHEFSVKGASNPSVGMMAKQPHMPPEMPSFWLPYFLVTDVDAAAEKAKSLGAQNPLRAAGHSGYGTLRGDRGSAGSGVFDLYAQGITGPQVLGSSGSRVGQSCR
jgi:hypothetical protein